jgi:hypothetical protein
MVSAGCGAQPAPSSTVAPTIGRISCGPGGPSVSSNVVAAPDGVHAIVTMPDPWDVIVEDESGPRLDAGFGQGESVSILGPGEYLIGCRDGDRDLELAARAPLTILDPNGVWVDDRLTCTDRVTGSYTPGEDAAGERGDLVAALRRHMTGLQDGDRIEPAGYPAATSREVRIVRAGTVIGLATYQPWGSDDGWILSVVAKCTDSGLGG